MAINAGTILAYLDLDTSKFGSALDMAQGQLTSFAGEGGGISGMLEGVGAAATTLGRTLTMGVTTPLVGIGAAAVSTGMTFDASMSNVLALSGATSDEFADLRDMAMEMGASTKFSASQAADAFGYMALAGWDAQQMIGGIPGVLDLAAAANMDLARASDIVTDTMTPFGMAAEEAGRAADVFAYAQANSNTNVLQMGDAMKYAAPNAAAFGMTLEDTAGAMGMLANAGIKGSMAGTTLNAILRDMKKNSENGAIAIGKQKVAITNADGSYRAYADIIRDVEIATHGMSASQRDAALAAVFGDEAIKGVNATLAQGSEALQTFTSELYDCEGSATQMAATMQDNLLGDITTLKSGIEGMAISLSDFLTPAIRAVVQGITKGVQWFNSLDSGIKNIVFRIGTIAAAIGPVLLVGGKLLGMVSGFAGPLGLVAAGFALVYQHSERLQGIVSTVTSKVTQFADKVKAGFTIYNDAISFGKDQTTALRWALNTTFGTKNSKAIQKMAGNLLTGFQKAKGAITGTVNGLGSFLGALVDGKPPLEALETGLSKVFGDGTVQNVMRAATSVRDTFAPALSVVKDFAGKAGDTLKALWDGVPGMLDKVKGAFESAKDTFTSVAGDIQAAWGENGIMGVFGVLGDHIGDALRSASEAASKGAEFIRDKIGEGLSLAAEWLMPKAQEWMGNLGTALQNAKDAATEKLPAVKEAIANGLQVAKTTLTSKAKQVMTWLGDAYRSETVQGLIGDLSGVASAIMAKITAAKTAITTKAGELLTSLATALGSEEVKEKLSDITGVAATLAEKITSGVGAWQTTAARLIGDLVGQLTDNGFLSTAVTGLGNVVIAIANGIGTAAENITGCATTLITSLVGKLTESGFIEETFTTAGEVVTAIGTVLGDASENIVDSATAIGVALVDGIADIKWTEVFTSAGSVVNSLLAPLIKADSAILSGATKLMGAVTDAMGKIDFSGIGATLGTVATNLIGGILDYMPERIERAGELVDKIADGIAAAGDALGRAASGLISGLVTWLLTPENWLKLLQAGASLVEGISKGIISLGGGILRGAGSFLVGVLDGIFAPILGVEPMKEWNENTQTVFEETYAILDEAGRTMEVKGFDLMLSLITAVDKWDTDSLYSAMMAWGVALENGITDSFTSAQWMASDSIVGLFAMVLDTTTDETERAKAYAALAMSDYPDVLSKAMIEDEAKLGAAAAKLMADVNTEIETAASALGMTVPEFIESGLTEGIPFLETAMDKVAEIASMTQDKAQVLSDTKATGEEIPSELAAGEEATKGEVTTATQGVSDTVTDTLEPLPGLMEELSKNGVSGMAAGVTATAPEVTTAVQTLSDEAVNTVLQTMSVETGQTIGRDFIGGVISGGQSQGSSLYTSMTAAGMNAVAALRYTMSPSTGHSIGYAMIQAVASGANSAGGALYSAMTSLANQAVSAFKSALDMHSPPRVFTEIGELIPVAVGIGTDKNTEEATKSIVRLGQSMQDAWTPVDFDDGWPWNSKTPGGGSGGASAPVNVEVHYHGDVYVRDENEVEEFTETLTDAVVDGIRGGG